MCSTDDEHASIVRRALRMPTPAEDNTPPPTQQAPPLAIDMRSRCPSPSLPPNTVDSRSNASGSSHGTIYTPPSSVTEEEDVLSTSGVGSRSTTRSLHRTQQDWPPAYHFHGNITNSSIIIANAPTLERIDGHSHIRTRDSNDARSSVRAATTRPSSAARSSRRVASDASAASSVWLPTPSASIVDEEVVERSEIPQSPSAARLLRRNLSNEPAAKLARVKQEHASGPGSTGQGTSDLKRAHVIPHQPIEAISMADDGHDIADNTSSWSTITTQSVTLAPAAEPLLQAEVTGVFYAATVHIDPPIVVVGHTTRAIEAALRDIAVHNNITMAQDHHFSMSGIDVTLLPQLEALVCERLHRVQHVSAPVLHRDYFFVDLRMAQSVILNAWMFMQNGFDRTAGRLRARYQSRMKAKARVQRSAERAQWMPCRPRSRSVRCRNLHQAARGCGQRCLVLSRMSRGIQWSTDSFRLCLRVLMSVQGGMSAR